MGTARRLRFAFIVSLFPLLLFDAVGERTRHQAALDNHAAQATGGQAGDERGQKNTIHVNT